MGKIAMEEDRFQLRMPGALKLVEDAPRTSSTSSFQGASFELHFDRGPLRKLLKRQRFTEGEISYTLWLVHEGNEQELATVVFQQAQLQGASKPALPGMTAVLTPGLPESEQTWSLKGKMTHVLLERRELWPQPFVQQLERGDAQEMDQLMCRAISDLRVIEEGKLIQSIMPGVTLVFSPSLKLLTDHLDIASPELLLFAGHGRRNQIILQEAVMHEDFLGLFRTRRDAGKRNPKCLVLNVCGEASGALPVHLVNEARVGLVIYWRSRVDDSVALKMSGIFTREVVGLHELAGPEPRGDVDLYAEAFRVTKSYLRSFLPSQTTQWQTIVDSFGCYPSPST